MSSKTKTKGKGKKAKASGGSSSSSSSSSSMIGGGSEEEEEEEEEEEGEGVVQSPCSLALIAAQANLKAVLAAAAYSTSPEHAQAAVAAARANLAAVEQARAAERANELAKWQQAVFVYLRLPLNHARYYLPPLPYPDPDIPYGIVFLANRRIMKRCFQAVVRYLDPQSVMKLRMATKEINREGERAMYRVWRYLVAVNLSSPFITLPAVASNLVEDPQFEVAEAKRVLRKWRYQFSVALRKSHACAILDRIRALKLGPGVIIPTRQQLFKTARSVI